MLNIPFFNLSRQYDLIGSEIEQKILEVCRSQSYIGGREVEELEHNLSSYLHVKHVITCASGTDALRIALQAVGVGPGDEVITSDFSFFATAEAITELGAVPVFTDIDVRTYNMDTEDIEHRITKKTKAILPVHIFGLPAEMDMINSIAARHGLPVIEDACQAFGAKYRDRYAGTLGKIGCFSFYPTKNLGAYGDGGMITTDDDDLAVVCYAARSHASGSIGYSARKVLDKAIIDEPGGSDESRGDYLYDPYKYYNYFSAWNSRLDAIQAAVLNVKLRYIDTFQNKRIAIAKRYRDMLANTGLITPISETDHSISCCHQYALLAPSRDGLAKYLSDKGVKTGNFYPVPLHSQMAFRDDVSDKDMEYPIATDICKRTVCLPIFPELTEDESIYIAEKCLEYMDHEQ